MLRLTPVSSALAALMVASVLSGCAGGGALTETSPAAAATTAATSPRTALVTPDLSANFETRTLAGWSSTAGTTVTATAAAHGSFGVQISSKQSPGFLSWSPGVVAQGRTYASLRAYFQMVSVGAGQSLDIFTIKNSRLLNNFDFFVTANSQKFKWDLYRGNAAQSAFDVVPGRWYLIEVQCDYAGTSYQARVRIDGVDQQSITSPGQVPSTVRSVKFGTQVSKTHVQRYDDLALKLGSSWPGYFGPVG